MQPTLRGELGTIPGPVGPGDRNPEFSVLLDFLGVGGLGGALLNVPKDTASRRNGDQLWQLRGRIRHDLGPKQCLCKHSRALEGQTGISVFLEHWGGGGEEVAPSFPLPHRLVLPPARLAGRTR